MAEQTRFENTEAPGMGWPYVMAPEVELETLRRAHLRTEASVRAIGMLSIIGGVTAAAAMPLGVMIEEASAFEVGWLALASVGSIVSGLMLRRFDPCGRLLYTVLTALGFVVTLAEALKQADPASVAVGFAGQLLGLVFLAIMWGPRARTVFGGHYRKIVIPATAHVRQARSWAWLIALFVFATLSVAGAIYGASVAPPAAVR